MATYLEQETQESKILTDYQTLCKYIQLHCEKDNADALDILSVLEDFLEISKELTGFFQKNLSIEQDTFWDTHSLIQQESFRSIFKNLAELTGQILQNYDKPLKKCTGCGERVHYFAFPGYYQKMRKLYHVPNWVRGECGNEKEYMCPVCGAFDRDRLAILYLKKCLADHPDASLLHIAPSKGIEQFILTNFPNLQYHTCDLYMKNVTFSLNIEHMDAIKDESYHFIICIDVLEHVEKDLDAIREFYRILKPNGQALIISPVCLAIDETDEDIHATEAERWKRFGQNDHIRLYAKNDFINRLRTPGFHVSQKDIHDFGYETYQENGLLETSVLYVLEKSLSI